MTGGMRQWAVDFPQSSAEYPPSCRPSSGRYELDDVGSTYAAVGQRSGHKAASSGRSNFQDAPRKSLTPSSAFGDSLANMAKSDTGIPVAGRRSQIVIALP